MRAEKAPCDGEFSGRVITEAVKTRKGGLIGLASVNFSGGKLHGIGEVCAQFRHSEKEERLRHGHANEDIDKAVTHENWGVVGLSYAEMRERYTARVAEVDKTAKNHRKDRVTCMCAVVPVPDGMTDEQAHDWYRDVWEIFEKHYGAENMIEACVHVDEKHDYVDPDTGETRTSRTHAHFYFVPERDGEFAAKHIISRAEMIALNRELDEVSRERYGLRFMDGTQAKSRGTVERLKRMSDAAEMERQIESAREQRLDALRERDAARADRDVVKAVSSLQKAVFSPQSVDIEILAEHEAKRSLLGRETPATVTISRDDYERLQEQASVNAQTRDAAIAITGAYKGIVAGAQEINRNRIDSFDRTRDEVTKQLDAEVKLLKQTLGTVRQQLKEQMHKAHEMERAADEVKQKADAFSRLFESFPGKIMALSRLDALSRRWDSHGLTVREMQEYVDLCGSAGVPVRTDIEQRLTRRMERTERER